MSPRLESEGESGGQALVRQLNELTERAARIIGLEERDFAVVAGVQSMTCAWGPAVADALAQCLLSSGELEAHRLNALADLEAETEIWFERLASGDGGADLWHETFFFGLTLAAWDVSAATARAFLCRLDERLTLNAAMALPTGESITVSSSFTRLLGVARVVVSHAYRLAGDASAVTMGLGEGLIRRVRAEAVPRMIDDAEGRLPAMTWDDSLAVGIPELDDARWRVLDRIDELRREWFEGEAGKRRAPSRLIALVEQELELEEQVYQAHALPSLPEHRAAHRELVDRMTAFSRRGIFAAPPSGAIEITGYLRTWLEVHLRVADRQAGTHVRARGIQ